MGDDSEKSTVDLTWARIPGRRVRQKNAITHRWESAWKSTLPKLLKALGPDEPMKLDAAWENERHNEVIALYAVVRSEIVSQAVENR